MTILNYIIGFYEYFIDNLSEVGVMTLEHIKLTFIAVVFACIIGIPIGILIAYVKRLNKPIMGLTNTVQAIPSMALLGLMIPLLGIGAVPAIVTVTLYSLLPIVKNTYIGLTNIDKDTIEAARGIGLTKLQILTEVQLPLALPVIMGGIRISAVTAVGLMTMAAFIGAGGLGYMVFAGIRSVTNYQILAGAIPACILALLIDLIVGKIEMIVTPISLIKGNRAKIIKSHKHNKIFISVTATLIIFMFIFSALTSEKLEGRVIKIGSKDYTEQVLVSCLTADMIESNTDIKIDRQLSLGSTTTAFNAIKQGSIDMYIEYTGSAYCDILKNKPISDMEKVYNTVKKDLKSQYNIETLKQYGFNNTFAMTVTKETAEKYNLKKVSDLVKCASSMKLGCVFEFLERADGLTGLEKTYGFKMGENKALDGAPRYKALITGEVDIIDAYSTDGLIKKFSLVSLEDDFNYFPPYYATPIIRTDTLEKYPEIVPVLKKLGKVLTNDVMSELNYRVDELNEKPKDVSKDFLRSIGFID